jgi:hypothetical protein
MARNKKSARILALLLALIMLGSVLAYTFKSGKTPEREIKFEIKDGFLSYIQNLPPGAKEIIYMDLNTENETLRSYVEHMIQINLNPYLFQHMWFQGVERMLVSSYPDGILYLIDVNKSKVYFSYEMKEEYSGFTIKVKQELALADELSPFLFGTIQSVLRAIDVLGKGNKLSYVDRLAGEYNVLMVFYGDSANKLLNDDLIDFYAAGFRMNGSAYEKVVCMHFTGNGLFVDSNATAYYSYTNYKDGLSVAVMGDFNLTKILDVQPEIRTIEIREDDRST